MAGECPAHLILYTRVNTRKRFPHAGAGEGEGASKRAVPVHLGRGSDAAPRPPRLPPLHRREGIYPPNSLSPSPQSHSILQAWLTCIPNLSDSPWQEFESNARASSECEGMFCGQGLGDRLSSNDVREYLLAGNEHPSKLFPDCFSQDPPVAAITYEWRLSFADILSYLNPAQETERNG